jgi:hypothetical protein
MNDRHEKLPLGSLLLGRTFVHPWFDYLVIGGGLSLLVAGLVSWPAARSSAGAGQDLSIHARFAWIPLVILLSNSTHFASSTVRLYSKPGTFKALPFLTMGFPLVCLLVTSLCMFFPGQLGTQLNSLYLTWSPYHYAAQAYGLAVMYSYRSGCILGTGDKRLLRWISLLPFFFMCVGGEGVGFYWLLPDSWMAHPGVDAVIMFLKGWVFPVLIFGMPVALFVKVWMNEKRPLPLISVLVLITNGCWFITFNYLQAFTLATIFHGIQYLAIVLIFHVRDQKHRPENRHGTLYHVVWFYGVSLLLGYGLFHCLPWAYRLAGFGVVESMLLVAAAINIHHFIVDAYIWKLGRKDSNRKIVDSNQSPALT